MGVALHTALINVPSNDPHRLIFVTLVRREVSARMHSTHIRAAVHQKHSVKNRRFEMGCACNNAAHPNQIYRNYVEINFYWDGCSFKSESVVYVLLTKDSTANWNCSNRVEAEPCTSTTSLTRSCKCKEAKSSGTNYDHVELQYSMWLCRIRLVLRS